MVEDLLPEENQMTATEILERDYQLQMDLIESFRKDGMTDEEILEFMRAN